ncbi:MAG: Rieske 2Fe-2S domain-containing protein [Actinomycetota bacterium]|nr:Rieske 2Fe-2S domain-containing protein [Actinomycetota bacterium]
MDAPVVVFRDGAGRPNALVDRCPHRNVPLSAGRVHAEGTLQCGYHGWRFAGLGRCVAVPGLLGEDAASSVTRDVGHHATIERDGFVWVWGEQDAPPTGDPFPFPSFPDVASARVGRVVFAYDLECTMHAALENALDVPHTAFLHAGIFRGAEARDITAVRSELPERGGLEVQYLDEPVGFGPIKLRGKTFDHWDRFFLPCVAQVEYRVTPWVRIVNTILHLPLSPFRTRAWFVVDFSSPVPAKAMQPIVLARGKGILKQDADFLALQTENSRRFGGERYTSTELDLIGNGIWRLLRQAERAERDDGPGDAADDDEPSPDRVNFRA